MTRNCANLPFLAMITADLRLTDAALTQNMGNLRYLWRNMVSSLRQSLKQGRIWGVLGVKTPPKLSNHFLLFIFSTNIVVYYLGNGTRYVHSYFFFFFYSILRWSVAVSTMPRQSSRIAALLQADARPMFCWPRSASTARSQVWLRSS